MRATLATLAGVGEMRGYALLEIRSRSRSDVDRYRKYRMRNDARR